MTFNKTRLANGLTVLTYHMPGLESVAINLVAGVGSRYETTEEAGISHFLEHMAFKGTKTRSAQVIAEEFDSIGGYFNAYTGREHTVYCAKLLHNNLLKALEILADIIQNSIFAREDIEKEYRVILQEIAATYDNPDDIAYEVLYDTAYSNQPFGRSILGTQDTIAGFNTKSFHDYLHKHYNADNLYLSIAGKVDHEEAVKFADRLFVDLNNNKKRQFAPAKYIGGYKNIVKDLEQTTVLLGFESTSYLNIDQFYHAQLLGMILGGGISSRLFQQIRENLGLAYTVGSYNSSYYDSGLFNIFAATGHENVNKLLDNINIEIKKIVEKVNEAELDRAKEQAKAGIYMSQEKSGYKSEEIGKNFAIFGKYFPVEEIITRITATTSQDIRNTAENIFAKTSTLSIVGAEIEKPGFWK